MNIFEEFNKQIASLTDVKVGDTIYSVSEYSDKICEETVKSIGYDPVKNCVVFNGYKTEIHTTREEAEQVAVERVIKSVRRRIENQIKDIKDSTDIKARLEKELAELLAKVK